MKTFTSAFAGLLLGLSITLAAQNITNRFFLAYSYENLTVDSTSGGVAFTTTKVNPSGVAYNAQSITFTIACDGGGTSCPIRMTLDGTAPTTSVGMRADYGSSVTIYSHSNILAFRAIREGSTSAILNTTYFR